MASRRFFQTLAAVGILGRVALSFGGTVTLDGSLGHAAGPVANNNGLYSLTPASGKQIGGNLFFSLGQFNLDKGETAQFSGPTSIANILTRVTGGQSNIDGTLQSTIAGANFYLINPAGVVFGPDARLSVKGSFAVSTADDIQLSDGAVFGTSGAGDATLTTASPAAFGFLSSKPAGVSINGSLTVPSGQSFTIAAGSVNSSGGTILASSGQIDFAAVGSSGTARLTGRAKNPLDVSSFQSLGAIQLANAQINSSGPTGGRIVIRAGLIQSTGSDIFAETKGVGTGGGIDLRTRSSISIDGGQISSNSNGPGNAGNLFIHTDALQLMAGASIDDIATSTGPGGNLTVSAGSIQIQNEAKIQGGTGGTGNGGNVSITTSGGLRIDGDAMPVSAGIFADSTYPTPGGGDGGTIDINVASLHLIDGGTIAATTMGTGPGGNVTVNVTGLAYLNGDGFSNFSTDIRSQASYPDAGGGNGGTVTVNAGTLQILYGAGINTSTSGTGNSGNIKVSVRGQAFLTGDGPNSVSTGILAQSEVMPANGVIPIGGAGGGITVSAGSLQIVDAARISSSTNNSAPAGPVSVSVTGLLLLDGGGVNDNTGISSQTLAGSTGSGGDLFVAAASMEILNGAEIEGNTNGAGNAGNVLVTSTGYTLFDGQGASVPTGVFSDANDSTPGGGNGGMITLNARNFTITGGSQIGAGTDGTGNSGKVKVDVSESLILDGAGGRDKIFDGIATQSTSKIAGAGAAGSVLVKASDVNIRNHAEITASTFGPGAGGNVTLTTPGDLTINGQGVTGQTGIFANSLAEKSGSGNAGVVNVQAASLNILDAGEIAAGTYGTGSGGAVDVKVSGAALLDGTGSATDFTGIANSTHRARAGGGSTGDIHVSAETFTGKDAGDINALSFGSGSAGEITVDSLGLMQFQSNGGIFVSAPQSHGGKITLAGGGNIVLQNGVISAKAVQLGNIFISSPADSLVLILGSTITAQAQTFGGQITIDPAVVVVGDGSLINGLAGDKNLIVDIAADALIVSPDSQILADRASFSVDTDVTAGLLALPPSVFGGQISLVPGCAHIIGGDYSSFVQTGNGGLAVEPGGFLPSFDFGRNPE